MSSAPLWTVEAMAQAMGAARAGTLPASISGISIDSRSIGRGEAFFAIQGDARDGHDFVAAALANGAGLAVVAADKRDAFPKDAPLLVVPDVLEGLRDLAARRARAFAGATSSASPARSARPAPRKRCGWRSTPSGETHASVASYNNHWGVPLSLARCPASARFAVFEMGMNHAGEIEPLIAAGAAACRHRHHHRAGASRISRLDRGDRRRQGGNLPRPRRRAAPR